MTIGPEQNMVRWDWVSNRPQATAPPRPPRPPLPLGSLSSSRHWTSTLSPPLPPLPATFPLNVELVIVSPPPAMTAPP